MKRCDYCIVGGGLAGLYAARRILQREPGSSVVILEKCRSFGGRARTVRFANRDLSAGAGIARIGKDRLLLQLLDELAVPYSMGPAAFSYAFGDPTDVRKQLARLPRGCPGTFESCARGAWGQDAYARFARSVGFTDFEGMGVRDALDTYGFDDTYQHGQSHAYVPWRVLLKALIADLKARGATLVPGFAVKDVNALSVNNGAVVVSRALIVAAPVDAVRTLLPGVRLYDKIAAQPFLRIYAQLTVVGGGLLVKGYTVVANALQKVLPVAPEAGVYMVGYSDNASAMALLNARKADVERMLLEALGKAVHIQKMRKVFWPQGTHYRRADFRRDPACLLRPFRRSPVYVIGEAVARNNGWVEGALETADDFIRCHFRG